MKITYKDFEEQDFDDFKEMAFCLYDEDPEGLPLDDEKIRKTVGEYTAHPEKLKIIVILDGSSAVGYGILVFYWSNEYGGNVVVFDELYIKKPYRNKQIASDFIKHQISLHEDAAAFELETTPSNGAAIRLYERLGFELSDNKRLLYV